MKLWVHVIEARGLPVMNMSGSCDPYVRLQLGNRRSKTKVVKKNLNPVWDEKFNFLVGELSEELIVTVINEDKYFNNDFLGKVKLSLLDVLDGENLNLGTTWYALQPKNKKSKNKNRGEICLSLSLSPRNSFLDASCMVSQASFSSSVSSSDTPEQEVPFSASGDKENLDSSPALEETRTIKPNRSNPTSFVDLLSQIFTGKNANSVPLLTYNKDCVPTEEKRSESMPKQMEISADSACIADVPCEEKYEDLLATMAAKDVGSDMPGNLTGGVLLDQCYAISSPDLNSLIFSPDSSFWTSFAQSLGSTDLQREPWKLLDCDTTLKRLVTYVKAASKLIKAVKATEEHTYLKADGQQFAVLASVSTPDVPCGSYFKTEILYCIRPGPQSPTSNPSSNLCITWRINFLQSTMMKGMIENGAKQGLTEGFAQFREILSKEVTPVSLEDSSSNNKEENLDLPEPKHESTLVLAFQFLRSFPVLVSLLVGLYVFAHILIANPSTIEGLEFTGLDLPDSLAEVLVSSILMLQVQYVLRAIHRFWRARGNGCDHGSKAQGDGWLLTVALVEGSNIAAVDSSGFSDPYVVFTCNGQTKTSSIKFQTTNPVWNEIFGFDAMYDPPSRMEVVVYDFEGPSDKALSLGYTEVDFLKSNLSELADVWIPLQGKYAQACQSRLHLRIFLNNSKGNEVITDYITKMEKEVGKKISLRSPQTNTTFQKLFGLPLEEFLINDFSCHLKRKMPLQGRLFLSPRVIGFHGNIFGHKTKFFILWDDIDDIQVFPPSLANVGSPSIIITLSKGRGMDAKHGAKEVDQDGRLRFHFQSFVSFNIASRTTMALWKARSLTPEQKMQLVQEESEPRDENALFLGLEDVKMLEVYSDGVPVAANSLMEVFEGGALEEKIMQKVGCIDYSTTPWQPVKADVYQRKTQCKLDDSLSCLGGEVSSTQQRYPLPDENGWIVEESSSLQKHVLAEYLGIQLKYRLEDISIAPKAASVQVYLGIAWLKNTKHRKKITKNLVSDISFRLKDMFTQLEIELLSGQP